MDTVDVRPVVGSSAHPGSSAGRGVRYPADFDARFLSAYTYDLPADLIAQQPVEPRDSSRLLVACRRDGFVQHSRVRFLGAWLQAGDVLVVNETRVFPARLIGRRDSGARVEWLLLGRDREDETVWRALVRPARRLRPGEVIAFSPELAGEVLAAEPGGVRRVRLHTNLPVARAIETVGHVPLPPYIHHRLTVPERYQTVYAREQGSVAAPTAGLHFTPGLLQALRLRGVRVVSVVLHVGPGTFRPVEVDEVHRHRMDVEFFRIPAGTATAVETARARGHRVVAVGTTVTRALEAAALGEGRVRAGEGWTKLFITPGFRFRVVQGLITNFHLPRSTLLMLVSAFYGRRRTLEAYDIAVRHRYRFYSFGDAMLIL